jgi:hypothetical protein
MIQAVLPDNHTNKHDTLGILVILDRLISEDVLEKIDFTPRCVELYYPPDIYKQSSFQFVSKLLQDEVGRLPLKA